MKKDKKDPLRHLSAETEKKDNTLIPYGDADIEEVRNLKREMGLLDEKIIAKIAKIARKKGWNEKAIKWEKEMYFQKTKYSAFGTTNSDHFGRILNEIIYEMKIK